MKDEFIAIADFKRYFKRRKKTYAAIGLFFSFFTMLLCLMKEPKYLLQASFKEATVRSDSSSAGMLRTLLKNPGSVDLGAQALSVMKSRQLIQRVVEEMGLQGDVKPVSLKERLAARIAVNYKLARGKVIEDSAFCRVKRLAYSGKETKRVFLEVIEEDLVELYSQEGTLLCRQNPSQAFVFLDATMSLDINSQGELRKRCLIEMYPMQIAVDKVLNTVKVKVRREDANFLDLVYKDKDPQRGALFLNRLMLEYKRYLVKENDRIARAQLEYLTTRQGEIADKLDETLKRHVDYLQATLGDKGFMGLHQELDLMESKKKRHQQRLLEIELDLNKVERIQAQKLFSLQDSILGQEGTHIQQTLLGLKKQKDGLDLTVMKRLTSFSEKTKQNSKRGHSILKLTNSIEGIKELEGKEEASLKPLPIFTALKEELKDLYFQKEKIDLKGLHFSGSQQPAFYDLKKELQDKLLNASAQQKNSLVHKIHLLDLREAILKQRLDSESIIPKELEGIDLEMAKKLHVHYVHEVDESRLKKRHLQCALNTIEEDSFEVSSITNLVEDRASQEIIKEMMQLSSELKNEKYLSDRDRVRLKSALTQKKEILKTHLEQMIHVSDLKLELMEDKIIALQQVIADLVNQDIAIIEGQIETLLAEKIEALNREREAIGEKLQQLQLEMKGIPQKWLIENRLQLQADLNVSMMEGMAQLIESKNVEHHLLQVESKPIDEAYVPLKPKHTSLFIYGLLGGFLSVSMAMGISVGRRVIKGFPVSLEGLKSRSLEVASPFLQKPSFEALHSLKERDLEILREMVGFALQERPLILGVVLNGYPNYTKILGKLLTLSGKKLLLIESLSGSGKEMGLLDYLSGVAKDTLIDKESDVHRVALGRGSYGVEMLSTPKFLELLEIFQSTYEVILMVTDKKAHSSEAHKFTQFSQKMIITLDEESLDDLYPYTYLEGKALYVSFE